MYTCVHLSLSLYIYIHILYIYIYIYLDVPKPKSGGLVQKVGPLVNGQILFTKTRPARSIPILRRKWGLY